MNFKVFLEENKAEKQALNMILDPNLNKEEYVLVQVNMKKLASMTSILTKGQYTRLEGEFGNKLERFANFVKTNKPIHAPYQTSAKMSEKSITLEGNHRLAYFFMKKVKTITIAIRKEELEFAKTIPNFLVNMNYPRTKDSSVS